MAYNVQGAVEVPLATFGGLDTEMSAVDIPEGVSPDCSDVEFQPGSVGGRRGLARVFPTALPQFPSVQGAKSYVGPDGTIRNLYLDSNGIIWVENVTTSPGVLTQLFQTAANSYMKAITAFGRQYIAISDGLHGAEMPLQYDGTFLDRVTQDGPGAPPSIASINFPALTMAAISTGPTLNIGFVQTTDLVNYGSFSYYSALQIVITSGSTTGLFPGQAVTISGNSNSGFNTTWYISSIVNGNTLTVYAYYPTAATGTGGTAAFGASSVTMSRSGNIVTVATSTPHRLQVGFQAQITGVPAAIVGTGITSIVVDNADLPGLATVTTVSAHGLVPGLLVVLKNVTSTVVGGAISAISRQGQVVTCTTTSSHGLEPGMTVTIGGVTDVTFDGTFVVQAISSNTIFTYTQADADATSSGGQVFLLFPTPSINEQDTFEVVSAPTPTTFQIQFQFGNATWAGGQVLFAWNGTFYVSAVLSPTLFQYQQYGPTITTTSVGTVTPFGQAAPGKHQMQVLFLTRQGYITRPSPPVNFISNGGQYLNVTNIPIGPPSVVARILAFTGANGAFFYYIPVAAQVNGQIVSTATQINDNTSTTAVLDFSDNTLYASLGINIPGNNLPNEIVLDGALGFSYYALRLITYGQRNTVQNFLNLGFEGGYLPNQGVGNPSGWRFVAAGGILTPGPSGVGQSWTTTIAGDTAKHGALSQGAYQDAYGAPITSPNTKYILRAWVKFDVSNSQTNFVAQFSSVSTGFLSTAVLDSSSLVNSTIGGFLEVPFDTQLPNSIPSDLILEIWFQSNVAAQGSVDNISISFAQTPYTDSLLYGSYVDNPEGFDGVSGQFGPATDTRKVMDTSIIRDTFYMVTQEPAGRLHETTNNGTTEPSGWTINEVSSNCGALSAFGLTKSQADDTSASGGEEWFAWASSSGARIFGGDMPWKVSQEIQPVWDRINPAGQLSIWALNDPIKRLILFGLPLDSATSPGVIYVLNYRELDTAFQISSSPPVRTSLSGRLIATDNVRKWAPWQLAMNGGAMMYHSAALKIQTTLFGGPNTGNVYILSAAKLTDDDYGQFDPYYTTYFFVNHDAEIQLGLGAHRKMVSYLQGYISGVGNVVITAFVNNLQSPWPLTCTRQLALEPNFDLEWTGGQITCNRVAFRIQSFPISGTDNTFTLQKLIATMKPATHLPVRGAAQ